MSSRFQQRRAFTLVELLVVIGIIALLISILMPALSAARNQANTLKCAANLRSIGQVMHQYAQDNRGYIPRDYSKSSIHEGHIFWAEAYARYFDRRFPEVPYSAPNRDAQLAGGLAKIQTYQCPVFPNELQPVDYVTNGWDKYTLAGRTMPAFKVVKFKRAAEVVFMTEANVNRSHTDFERHDIWSPAHLPRRSEVRILDDARHRKMLNACFLDGHVVTQPFHTLTDADFRTGMTQ